METKRELSRPSMPSRDEVVKTVARIVAEQVGAAPERIRESDTLIQDLGCDSLDVIEISMEIEEQFDLTVPEEQTEHDRTVGEIADGVLQLLHARRA